MAWAALPPAWSFVVVGRFDQAVCAGRESTEQVEYRLKLRTEPNFGCLIVKRSRGGASHSSWAELVAVFQVL
jgi:hypothetical protein